VTHYFSAAFFIDKRASFGIFDATSPVRSFILGVVDGKDPLKIPRKLSPCLYHFPKNTSETFRRNNDSKGFHPELEKIDDTVALFFLMRFPHEGDRQEKFPEGLTSTGT
jgi:hypothetical protein